MADKNSKEFLKQFRERITRTLRENRIELAIGEVYKHFADVAEKRLSELMRDPTPESVSRAFEFGVAMNRALTEQYLHELEAPVRSLHDVRPETYSAGRLEAAYAISVLLEDLEIQVKTLLRPRLEELDKEWDGRLESSIEQAKQRQIMLDLQTLASLLVDRHENGDFTMDLDELDAFSDSHANGEVHVGYVWRDDRRAKLFMVGTTEASRKTQSEAVA